MLRLLWLAPMLAAGLVASHSGAWLHGRAGGVRATEARHLAQPQATECRIFREAEALSQRARDLDAAQAPLRERARKMEDAARLDADPSRVPAAHSLRRLRQRCAAD